MTDGTLYAWKFLIPSDKICFLPEDPSVGFGGCIAVAIAASELGARLVLEADAKKHGDDARWLTAATVERIPLTPGAVLAWALT